MNDILQIISFVYIHTAHRTAWLPFLSEVCLSHTFLKSLNGCLLTSNHGIIEHVLKLFPVILRLTKGRTRVLLVSRVPAFREAHAARRLGPQVSPTEQLFWVALLVSPEHHPVSPSAKQCKRSHWPVLRGTYEELRTEWNSYFKMQV